MAKVHEPLYKKTNNLGFRSGPTKTSLYLHRSRLEAFSDLGNCEAKMKVLISFTFTAHMLIVGFLMQWLSHVTKVIEFC